MHVGARCGLKLPQDQPCRSGCLGLFRLPLQFLYPHWIPWRELSVLHRGCSNKIASTNGGNFNCQPLAMELCRQHGHSCKSLKHSKSSNQPLTVFVRLPLRRLAGNTTWCSSVSPPSSSRLYTSSTQKQKDVAWRSSR